jgi:hypothetical protein
MRKGAESNPRPAIGLAHPKNHRSLFSLLQALTVVRRALIAARGHAIAALDALIVIGLAQSGIAAGNDHRPLILLSLGWIVTLQA